MIQTIVPVVPQHLVYPESDGQPLAENTKQARWITILFGNLCALFRDAADVFVAMDLFWYPVEGQPEVRMAPDVLLVFGRPKGDRGSYRQWDEESVPVTVVFEILSPSNDRFEMADKLAFYDEQGVEEYYAYDPDSNRLLVYVRRSETLVRVRPVHNFVSPRLKIRFDLSGPEMVVYGPDGQRFLSFEELAIVQFRAEQQVSQEKQRADQEKQRADQEKQRADQAEQRAARMAELSRKARRQQASPDELTELERLEGPTLPRTP